MTSFRCNFCRLFVFWPLSIVLADFGYISWWIVLLFLVYSCHLTLKAQKGI